MRPKVIVAIACVLVSVVVALLVAFVGNSEATTTAATRNLYVSAVEWKGSASVAKEPYPGPVPSGGGSHTSAPLRTGGGSG